MLQAQNGRQFNLAAKAARSFFAEKGVELKHSEALTLIARLTGHANYEAAQARLEGPKKGVETDIETWRDLGHAIGTLDEAQLALPIQVSEGCDENGNATFTKAVKLVLAHGPDIEAAGCTVFEANQPVLLVEEFNPELESDDALRVELQFEVATGQPGGMALYEIRRHGIDYAVKVLNADHGTHIGIGKFLAFCEKENAYWNADFGYVGDKDTATGYDTIEEVLRLYVDAVTLMTPVLYSEAADINFDA